MKFKFITDPQDPSDGFGFLDTVGAEVYSNFAFRGSGFSPPALQDVGSPPSGDPVEIPSTALVSEAVQASGAQSGATTTFALTSGGITINLLFDAAAMAAPPSFRAGIQQAASLLTAAISDKITINIKIDYSGTGGGAAAGPDNGQYVNYSTVRADLINNATPSDTTFNALPAGSTIQGQSEVAVWNAQLKLWGFLGASDTTTNDGSATFATDINPNLLVGVALHELTHAMGRVPSGPQPDVFDFYRFTSAGTRLFSGNATAPAAYFSVNGGNTKIADYGQTSDSSDFLNSGVQGPNDPFNEFYTSNTLQQLTAVDLKQLDALGFHPTSNAPIVIQTDGSTSLVQVGANYFFNPVGGGTGPELQYNGSPVYAGEYGSWSPIGAVQVSGGYDLAWKNASTGQFTVWDTDSNGAWLANLTGAVAGNSTTLESFETIFHQDLNGDGVIGIPAVVIQTDGSTSLVQVGANYFFNPVGGGTGPELQYNGSPVYAGEYGSWSPIGAVQVSGGYDLAWKNASTGQFTVWDTDSNGAWLANLTGAVAGNSTTLESFETIFHQDLNGDGVIGIPAVVIQTDGSTSLVQVGANYFFNPVGGGTGPELQYNGSPVYAGEYGSWSPIGAVQVSGGYDLAWKNASTGQFTVWDTDSNGAWLANLTGAVAGNSTTLESFETIFHQDLNGDGVIGIPAVVIQTDGSTSLVQVGANYFFNPVGGGTGPELQYNGSPVYAGEYGSWSPIGAVQVSGGYDLAWKNASTGQFTVWDTDSNGAWLANLTGAVAGNSTTLESFETIFHQDLNGDGVIGIPAVVIQTDGSTSLVQVGANYFFNPVGGGTGPELQYNGSPVYAGEYGSWSPIGAVQVSGGYDLAWKNASTGQFTVWDTDSNGAWLANLTGAVAGNSTTLESFETIFHQDLNGDGVIGIPLATQTATIQVPNVQLGSPTFDGTTLTLDIPSIFEGQIVGFTGDGTLAGSDQIDVRGLNYNSMHSSFNNSSETLTVSDSSTTASLQFLGRHLQDNFHFADDGTGGTIVYNGPTANQIVGTANQIASGSPADMSNIGAHDTFVFATNFGQINLANFAPATDTIQFSKSVFANIDSLLAATHDDVFGNAVITDAKHDTITIQHVTTAQLLTHQSDFYFV